MIKLEIELTEQDFQNLMKIKNEDISIKSFVERIVKDRVSFIFLDNGYYYNLSSDELFGKHGNKIRFTKTEKALFNYLAIMSLKGENVYADIETIKKDIWKNDDTTVFSIRNKINSIRMKTFDEIIKNKSNHGYRININLPKEDDCSLSA